VGISWHVLGWKSHVLKIFETREKAMTKYGYNHLTRRLFQRVKDFGNINNKRKNAIKGSMVGESGKKTKIFQLV
jgi:hypothetical protein